jgi:hypothetical protein
MFDADIALALGVALALTKLAKRRNPFPHIGGRALALACMLPLAVLAFEDREWHDGSFWIHPMHDEAAVAAQDISFMRAHRGPAMCETLAFCYWSGKPADVDVFNLNQQLITRGRDAAPIRRLLDARHFTAIELDETTPFPLPLAVESKLLRNYRIDHRDEEGIFFVPR